jgi:hypothetical protein
MVNSIFGREETPNFVAIKSKAHIYHLLFQHNEVGVSSVILDGIKKVALKGLSKEDIKKLEETHLLQKRHRL